MHVRTKFDDGDLGSGLELALNSDLLYHLLSLHRLTLLTPHHGLRVKNKSERNSQVVNKIKHTLLSIYEESQTQIQTIAATDSRFLTSSGSSNHTENIQGSTVSQLLG